MGINFPSAPTVGQLHPDPAQAGFPQYRWDGNVWIALAEDPLTFVKRGGDTMAGNLTLANDPTVDLHAATKRYVDLLGDDVEALTDAVSEVSSVRNRFVNGAMQISQERGNAISATQSTLTVYMADQWQTVAMVSPGTMASQRIAETTPYGSTYRVRAFVVAIKASLAAGDRVHFQHRVEGFNTADFLWGTPAAKQIIIRLGIKAPAGTYAISLRNDDVDRSYVTLFTVSAGQAGVDTEHIFVVPGDTTGVWNTTNSTGVIVDVTFGCGTTNHGAIGWQAGSFLGHSSVSNIMASSANEIDIFDCGLYVDVNNTGVPPRWELPDYTMELQASQRYWMQITPLFVGSYHGAGGAVYGHFQFPTAMRTTPTISYSSIGYANASNLAFNTATNQTSTTSVNVTALGYGYASYAASLSARL